jgi:NAD(P)-dependent dehydrogenase (short-subunit alcohol dehydrogenase family)
MTIAASTVLVTGANRGIGQALVEEALARGAKRAYAGTRQPLARVHAVLTGPTDTYMNRGLDIPKASAASVARAIFDGVQDGEEDIFPDPLSQSMAESWRSGAAKAFERQLFALLAAEPVTS